MLIDLEKVRENKLGKFNLMQLQVESPFLGLHDVKLRLISFELRPKINKGTLKPV